MTGACITDAVMYKAATPEICLSRAYLASLFCIL